MTEIPARTARSSSLALALLLVYLIWGSTYLVMRIALVELPPLWMGAARYSIAGAVLAFIAHRRGVRFPTKKELYASLPLGTLLFVGGNGLVAIGELEVSSGLAAVIVATMPLWSAVFGMLFGERPTAREWGGVMLGLVGVVVLVSGAELAAAPVAAAVLFASPMAWALGSLLSRRLPVAEGLMGSATLQLAGGFMLVFAGFIHGESLPTHVGATTLWAMAYLIVFGSILAFSAYAWLLRNARPAVATSYAFVNPPLAVLLGAMFGAEQVTITTIIATPIIVAAVVLVVGQRRVPRAALQPVSDE